MAQRESWEKEYKNMKLITGGAEPQKGVLKFYKYLKKEKCIKLDSLKVLDLGSGTGRNSNYLASKGNELYGIEISRVAVNIAQKRAKEMNLDVKYICDSFGKPLDFPDDYFDLVLDITSSNSLDDTERKMYLKEVYRVLKPDGNFFVRALSKEGDKNAKNLLKLSPGNDPDSYFMKELGLFEKVFTAETFREIYGRYFKIELLLKKSGYASISGKKYKRNYLIGYLRKRLN